MDRSAHTRADLTDQTAIPEDAMLDELESVDQSTIEELTTIEQEQATLRERLDAMEEKKDHVSEVVYQRVRSDYETRFQTLEEQALPLRDAARVEYAKLQDLLGRMQAAVEAARLAREELEFRRELGEFDDEAYASKLGEANEELERVEGELTLGEEVRERFIAAFPSEEDLMTAAVDDPPFGALPEELAPLAETDDVPLIEDGAAVAELAPGDRDLASELELDTGETVVETAPPEPPQDELDAEPDIPPPPPETSTMNEATIVNSLARFVAPEGNGHPEEYPLQPHETSIGRAPGNDIQIQDAAVSRRHAKVIAGDAGYAIIDLGSENGIYVNRERVTERVLEDGDIVEIGPGTKTFIFRRH